MSSSDHVPHELLVRAIDEETTASEAVSVESHLSVCALCRDNLNRLAQLSTGISLLVNAVSATDAADALQFHALLASRQSLNADRHTPAKVMRRFGWGMAIAAGLALGIVLAPHSRVITQSVAPAGAQSQTISMDINGENFISLPYSDPALPVNTARVVQMQVPASSLASAGIVLEPIGTSFSSPDRTVLADVLLGIDGQPLGVHVLSVE